MAIENVNSKMYDNYFLGKELKFYNNHKSDVKENMLAPTNYSKS
jgi:hypothetical protein